MYTYERGRDGSVDPAAKDHDSFVIVASDCGMVVLHNFVDGHAARFGCCSRWRDV